MRVLKIPYVSVETVSKRPQGPLSSVNIYHRCSKLTSRGKAIYRLLHESVTPSYNRNNSDGEASQKRQKTPQTTTEKQRVTRFCCSYV